MKNINSLLFDKCQLVFPLLNDSILSSNEDVKMISSCHKENDIVLTSENINITEKEIVVNIFIEFLLGKERFINPKFKLNLDFKNKKAYVLSYESTLFPHIKLDVYSEFNGVQYKNIIAEQDLETLCLNWLKQIVEYNYLPKCTMNQTA